MIEFLVLYLTIAAFFAAKIYDDLAKVDRDLLNELLEKNPKNLAAELWWLKHPWLLITFCSLTWPKFVWETYRGR